MKVLLINGSPKKNGNTFLALSEVPVVSSQYWNIVHGLMPSEVTQDEEGLQTMRTLGKNMAWLIKNIKQGAQPVPESEEWIATNFIR